MRKAVIVGGAVALAGVSAALYSRSISQKDKGYKTVAVVRGPVTCAGRLVEPGDLVVADPSGVVAIRQHRVEEVLAAAAARRDREARMLDELRRGRTTLELLGLETP